MVRQAHHVLLFIFLLVPNFAISGNILDLTHPFNEKTIYWPTAGGFELKKVFWGFTEKGYYYASNVFCTPEHGGTHLDAPIHFAKRAHTVDEIPAEQLVGEAYVINLRDLVGNKADTLITAEHIKAAEKKNGKIGPNHIVLFNTGWGRFWGNKKKYLGTAQFGDTKNLHFPGLSEDAARYLVRKKVKGVGLDTPSLDYGPSQDFMAHRVLLGANIYGLENVANLDRVRPGSKIIVAPMKIEQGTGAPVRIFAIP